MTLNQLSYYLAVCKHQNLTKAAAELSVSQPGLSAAITHTQNGLVFRKREKPGQPQQKRPGTWREAAEAVVKVNFYEGCEKRSKWPSSIYPVRFTTIFAD